MDEPCEDLQVQANDKFPVMNLGKLLVNDNIKYDDDSSSSHNRFGGCDDQSSYSSDYSFDYSSDEDVPAIDYGDMEYVPPILKLMQDNPPWYRSRDGYLYTPSVVASGAELDDSPLMYKHGHLFPSNPNAKTLFQNTRDHPSGMQSTPDYNMSGQSPLGASMPSHSGHASLNLASGSSHMQQCPGFCAVPNSHHLSPAMGVNIGVGPPGGTPEDLTEAAATNESPEHGYQIYEK